MLTAYLMLLCEFFWEFSIFHFCRPLVDIYWHPVLILVLLLWRRCLSHKKCMYGKTKSEYLPFFDFRRIGDNPNKMEQRPLAIRDRLIRKLAVINSIQKKVHQRYLKLCPQFTTDTGNYQVWTQKVKVLMRNSWPWQTASQERIQKFSIWYQNLPLSSHYLSFRKQKIKRMIGNCVNFCSTIRGYVWLATWNIKMSLL